MTPDTRRRGDVPLDDRPDMVRRYLGELKWALDRWGGFDGLADLDSQQATAVGRSARGVIRYSGRQMDSARFGTIAGYGPMLLGDEFDDAAGLASAVLEHLDRAHFNGRAASMLDVIREAYPGFPIPRERSEVERIGAILERRAAEQRKAAGR